MLAEKGDPRIEKYNERFAARSEQLLKRDAEDDQEAREAEPPPKKARAASSGQMPRPEPVPIMEEQGDQEGDVKMNVETVNKILDVTQFRISDPEIRRRLMHQIQKGEYLAVLADWNVIHSIVRDQGNENQEEIRECTQRVGGRWRTPGT